MIPNWVISDTHFFHTNLITKMKIRPNDFQERLVTNWLNMVSDKDSVLHLGDVLMGPRDVWYKIPRLHGKVEVIVGNHDESHKMRFIQEKWGWKFREDLIFEHKGYTIICTHEPMDRLAGHVLNVHGHIHEKPAPSRNHINVSCEWTEYAPVYFRGLLDKRIEELES